MRRFVEDRRYSLVVVDKLSYASRLDGIHDAISHPRVAFLEGDIADPEFVRRLMADFPIEGIINLAAESHVDRSIDEPMPFVQSNIVGVVQLLEAARASWSSRNITGRWLQVSTDEVYGSRDGETESDEDSPLLPNSPYAASKASADLLLRAYRQTYDFPVIITRSCNNYGPYQNDEKLIPRLIKCALGGQSMPLYGDGQQVREWIHVDDHAQALQRAFEGADAGATYNIGTGWRLTNLELSHRVKIELERWAESQQFNLPPISVEHVSDRQGHDRRYALDSKEFRRAFDWSPQIPFDEGLRNTVGWLAEDLLQPVNSTSTNSEP